MRSTTITGRTLAVGIIAALVGVAVGLTVVMTTRARDRGVARLSATGSGSEPAARPRAASSDAAAAGSAAASPAPGPGAGETEPSSSAAPTAGAEAAGDASDGAVTRLLADCAGTTGRRDEAVHAAREALGDWRTHYGAQLAFDRGEISSDEAARRWAASKEPAQRNLDALAAATDAIGTDDPCAQLDGDDAVTGATAEAVRACMARADLAADALDAAQEPLQSWRDHLQMMASNEQYGTDEYLSRWARMVSAAPGEMRGFDRAVADWREAPACDPAT